VLISSQKSVALEEQRPGHYLGIELACELGGHPENKSGSFSIEPSQIVPVAFKVGHEIRADETIPKLADLVRRLAGHDRVLSTGTLIDSLRLRVHLAERLEVSPASVEAQVVGEHGTSEVMLWSSARVSGVPVAEVLQAGSSFDDFRQSVERDVRYANITIIEGNAASQFGIGIVSARIAEAVLRDERVVLPIGAYNTKYGVTLSLPSVVGREGVNRILEPAMSDEERQALAQSAKVLRQAVQRTAQIP